MAQLIHSANVYDHSDIGFQGDDAIVTGKG